jgi:TPP-dependent pyruvate/acetoin dehydrogenase alpha subunit
LTTLGEEALNIASAAALTADDLVLPQVNLLSPVFN